MNKEVSLSIVTVCYNAIDNIENTVMSIIPHVSSQVEYIVIDGASTDGTLEIMEKYKPYISVLISEKDNGIYDAMNKGIRESKGNWCIFMNAGDRLLSIPSEIFQMENCKYSAIACPVEVDNNKIIYPSYNWWIRINNTLPHQGLFYNLKVECIAFDTQFRIFSDYDLNLKFYHQQRPILLTRHIVAFHSLIGVSNIKKYAKELFEVIKKNEGTFIMLLSYMYFKFQGLNKRIALWKQKR